MKDQRQQKIDSFIYPEFDEQDYVLGAERHAPFEVINESGDWRDYLPEPEEQRKDIDTYGCTNYGSLNIIEILEIYQRKLQNNYSERFQAVMSNQKPIGNDPHKVLESIRNDGVIDDDILPFKEGMTFDEYKSPQPMLRGFTEEAKAWRDNNIFKHEYVYSSRDSNNLDEKKRLLSEALKRSPVGVSAYAWHKRNGVYTKPEGAKDTHWTVLVAIDGGQPVVFDSYAPFLKTLSWEHFDVAKGVYLKYEPNKQTLMATLMKALQLLIEKLNQKIYLMRPVYPIAKALFIDRLSQGWGVRNPSYKSGIHMGADFSVPVGTPIYAPHDGEIYQNGNTDELGNYCFYKTEINTAVRYYVFMHLLEIPPKGHYKKAEQMALSGNTGLSTGSHLHLERWTVDPVDVDTRYKRVLKASDIRMYTRDPYSEFRYEVDGVVV